MFVDFECLVEKLFMDLVVMFISMENSVFIFIDGVSFVVGVVGEIFDVVDFVGEFV